MAYKAKSSQALATANRKRQATNAKKPKKKAAPKGPSKKKGR